MLCRQQLLNQAAIACRHDADATAQVEAQPVSYGIRRDLMPDGADLNQDRILLLPRQTFLSAGRGDGILFLSISHKFLLVMVVGFRFEMGGGNSRKLLSGVRQPSSRC